MHPDLHQRLTDVRNALINLEQELVEAQSTVHESKVQALLDTRRSLAQTVQHFTSLVES